MVHVNTLAGSVPCCGSVAWPEKLMVSPTAQQGLVFGQAVGVSIKAVGGVLFTLMVTEVVLVALCLSVTLRLAV